MTLGTGTKLSREEALHEIALSALYGNLGFLVGAGFSKAFVLDEQGKPLPLSWGELLKKACKGLEVDFDALHKPGRGYPEVASQICETYAKARKVAFSDATMLLKDEVCRLSSWLPQKEVREEIGQLIMDIGPAWIMTTNYDFVLESMLVDHAMQLGPRDALSAPRGVIPIYHLHGHRLDPASIVITQEDYTGLHRPNEYRQSKLPLQMMESTIISLGYGIGDPNVLVALDWSRNVLSRDSRLPSGFFQVHRATSPQADPIDDRNGVVVLQTSDIKPFLAEVANATKNERTTAEKRRNNRKQLTAALKDPKKATITRFIDEDEFRDDFIKTLGAADILTVSGTIQFLSKCIDETWERSAANGAFWAYDQQLKILLDFLEKVPLRDMHPVMFDFLLTSFDRVGYYVGTENGQSWAAAKTWEQRRGALPADTVKELKGQAKLNEKAWVYALTKDL